MFPLNTSVIQTTRGMQTVCPLSQQEKHDKDPTETRVTFLYEQKNLQRDINQLDIYKEALFSSSILKD